MGTAHGFNQELYMTEREACSPLSGTYRSSAGMSGKAELIFLKDMFF